MDVLQSAWGTLVGMGRSTVARLPLVAVALGERSTEGERDGRPA